MLAWRGLLFKISRGELRVTPLSSVFSRCCQCNRPKRSEKWACGRRFAGGLGGEVKVCVCVRVRCWPLSDRICLYSCHVSKHYVFKWTLLIILINTQLLLTFLILLFLLLSYYPPPPQGGFESAVLSCWLIFNLLLNNTSMPSHSRPHSKVSGHRGLFFFLIFFFCDVYDKSGSHYLSSG